MSDETDTSAEPEVTSDTPPKAPTQGERIAALEETVRGLASTVIDLSDQMKSIAADLAMLVDTGATKAGIAVNDAWIDRVLNKYHAHERPE